MEMFKSEGSETFRENQAFALWAIKGQPCLKVMGKVLQSKQSSASPALVIFFRYTDVIEAWQERETACCKTVKVSFDVCLSGCV